VDFAALYLNHSYRASPQESVWIDEENLAMQEPMFEVRKWYQRYGLETENWRVRPDDHLVCQLEFMAILLSDQSSLDILKDVAQFLDEHLLRWIRRFAKCAAQRCENDFYATLAMLTAVYVDELRDLLANALDYPRPTEEEIETRMKMKKAKTAVSMQYIPGMAESW
jgi:TorA maturation chaperone TorD